MSLTPKACSVHTHSTLCDGRNTLAEMAAAAYAAGVRHFGASGHSPTPIPHDAGNVLPGDMAEYRAAVEYMENCGVTDGYTQERTSAKEEYTPAFDLRGV